MQAEHCTRTITVTAEMFSTYPDLTWETDRGADQLTEVVYRIPPKEDSGHSITTPLTTQYGLLYKLSLQAVVMQKLIISEADTIYKQKYIRNILTHNKYTVLDSASA